MENIQEDIQNSINQGLTVRIPAEQLTTRNSWSGIGYIKEDRLSGEAGYMLAGLLAGGMTTPAPGDWSDYFTRDLLANPFSEAPNTNPDAVTSLKVIHASDFQEGIVGQPLATPLQVIALDKDGLPVAGVTVTFSVQAGGGAFDAGYASKEVTVLTDSSGIAQAPFYLSKSTSENPAYRWMTTAVTHPYNIQSATNTNSPRVDASIIDAQTTSGIMVASPITALAFPDQPVKMVKLLGDNQSGALLTWLGPVIVSVQDQYDNPVSNVDVTFTIADPVEQTPCAKANQDSRPGLLVSVLDPCMSQVPVYGECGSPQLTFTSSDQGSPAQVILGAVPDAVYKVTASGAGLQQVFSATSLPFGNCDDQSFPEHNLVLKSIYLADDNGQTINAGQVGSSIPLQARMYFASEGMEERDVTFSCSPDKTCPVEYGNRTYSINTDFVSDSLTFNGQQASGGAGTAGLYSLDYQVPATPGKHTVAVQGTASTYFHTIPDVCTSCDEINEELSLDASASLEVYAVDIATEPAMVIPVDENGFVTRDIDITYTIQPLDYRAGAAYVILYKNETPLMYIPTELQGKGFASLPRGYKFELRNPDTNSPNVYEAEVVLNEGSAVEIRSGKIALPLITLELDADLNRDGVYSEDDPEEHIGLGLLIQVNNDDDDGDGIVDSLDGFDLDPNEPNDDAIVKIDGTAVADDDLVEVKFTGLPFDHAEGTVVLEVTKGQDKIRIWQAKEKGKDNILIEPLAEDAPPDAANPRKEWVLGADNADMSALPGSIYIEGIKSSDEQGDVVLVTRILNTDGQEIEADKIVLSVFNIDMVPDYNHDRKIDDAVDFEYAKINSKFCFWINDDDDPDDSEVEGDDIPGQDRNADAKNEIVDGTRDLVDFFPVFVDLKEILDLLGADNYRYVLSASQADSLNVVFTDLTPDKAGDYLVVKDVALQVAALPVEKIGAEGITLSSDFLTSVKDSGQGIILVEAKDANADTLTLKITNSAGNDVLNGSLPLSISGVEEMYNRVDLRPVIPTDSGGSPVLTPATNTPDVALQNDKNFVFIHGYNVSETKARGWLSEIYKRMYWSGSLAKFHGVTWQGNEGQKTWPILGDKTPDYHVNVVNALDTAPHFASVINNIGPNVILAAHSLGNMVAAAAVALHGANVKQFFMIDAAVAIEAFDGRTALQSIDMVHPDWDDYEERLWSSEWHELFSNAQGFTDDGRHKLTWRNYFSNTVNEAYNFYSEGEEVLETHEHSNYPGLLDVDIFSGQFAWAMQEKLKGRTWVNAGGSTYGGWGLNFEYYIPDYVNYPDSDVKVLPLPPDQAALLTNDRLREEPFFEPGSGEIEDLYVPEGSGGTDVGSGFAEDNIRSLLAGYIPARTLPLGANPLNSLLSGRNFNMQAELQNDWPQERIGGRWGFRWLHSDLKEISYLYVHPLFKKFVEEGGLQ